MSQADSLTEIFLRACTLSPDSRAAFLDEACAGDASLRAEVEAMLAADARAGSGEGTDALAARVGRIAADATVASATPRLPDRIGPYRILEVLGEGGMGVVYRAEQTEPVRREVALKLVRIAIDSAGAVARFESERQALAMMDHPNIAHLLDAGSTDDGRPYFVMELVRGVPITEHCKAGRLPVRDRVRLFLDVCRAVRHAHRHGVIHRDLKPSNILITREDGQPVPKVIDFSIAKALGEPALGTEFRTRTGQLIGTLEYMSPEQAMGRVGAVDTRSDVYALGVILHELIAERLPHDVAGQPLLEAVRRIAEEAPRSLRGAVTTATGRLDADLDTIAGKCLEKDPDRRYGSAAELADDMERYLDSRPIQARPPSTIYQFRKLVARHKAVFGAAALAFGLLLVFSVVVTIQLGVQRRERARAEHAAEEARRAGARAERINAFLQEILASADPSHLGRNVTVLAVLEQAERSLGTSLEGDFEAIADAHHTLGVTFGGLGRPDRGLTHLRMALDARRRIRPGDHPDVADDLAALAWVHHLASEETEAVRVGWEAIGMWRRLAGEPNVEIAHLLGRLAVMERERQNLEEAERLARASVTMWTAVPGVDERRSALAQSDLSRVLWARAKAAEGLEVARKAADIQERILGPHHPETLETLFRVGNLLDRNGKLAEAEEVLRDVVERSRMTFGRQHVTTARYMMGHGWILWFSGKVAEAQSLVEEILRIMRMSYSENHRDVRQAVRLQACLQCELEDYGPAERTVRHLIATEESSGGKGDFLPHALAGILHSSGRYEEAEPIIRQILALDLERRGGNDVAVAGAYAWLGSVILDQGRLEEAEPLLRTSIEKYRELNLDHTDHALGVKNNLARLLGMRGHTEESEALFASIRASMLLVDPARPLAGRRHLFKQTAAFYESRSDRAEAKVYRDALARWEKAIRTLIPPKPAPITTGAPEAKSRKRLAGAP